jgi:hypothetical protein
MSPENMCVFCGGPFLKTHIEMTSLYGAECKVCGKYTSDDFNDMEFGRMNEAERAMISAYTRELYEDGSPVPALHILDNGEQIPRIIERYAKKTIQEKLNNLLLYVERNSDYFGEPFEVIKERDYPVTYSPNKDEFINIKRQAILAGFLERSSTENKVRMSWKGMEKNDENKRTVGPSTKCFVAMSCEPAIETTKYQPVLIERSEHNEKICDLILAEIRACKFAIVDVTLQKQNVYYEAGFAQGLNKDVIWSCRSNEKDNVHFDTRQYNHIFWDNSEDLHKKLIDRIRATIL